MNQDLVIKTLFIEPSLDQAERIISCLRNAGIAIRPERATDLGELTASLDSFEPDLVLADPALEEPALRDVVHAIDALGRDIALIALIDRIDNEVAAELFGTGVRGIALRKMPEQIVSVVQREFGALQTRRQVRALETALRESERRCDALLDSSTDAIAYVHEGMHVRANQAYLKLFGYDDFDDLMVMPVLDLVHANSEEDFKTTLRAYARKERAPAQLELTVRRADGSTFNAAAEFAHASFEGEPCLQVVFRRQVVDPGLIAQLQRDPVTGFFNRSHLLDTINTAVASAAQGERGQTLLLVEPDHWQATVAGIGLVQADQLLAALAERVRAALGEHDLAGMLGDHTFGIVLASRPDAQVREWVTSLQEAIATQIFDVGSRSITLSASLGGSLLGERNANSEQLLEQAGAALRTAQSQGSGRMELHDPAAREKDEEARERFWLSLLEEALEHGSFALFHQRVVSLQEAEGDYSEVLLRLDGPQGDVAPGFFMPIAEKHGLGPAIDRWVIERAIAALKAREDRRQINVFFVKLNVLSAQDPTLAEWIAERLAQAQLQYGRLILEMNESKVVTLLRPAQEFARRWKALGGQFALSQFGSGLNSFQLLDHLQADYLKIDRTFMAELPQHPENQQRIAAIATQARERGKQTVAEWVEDATSTALLFTCGVDFVQGNFLQEPQRLVA